MRHIDDLRFEIEALKVHALRSNNESLSASADFMTDTLNSLEQSLNERDEPINTPWAFPVGRSDND